MEEGEPAKIRPKRSTKRKRAESFPVTFSSEEKLEKIDGFRSEIESLVKFCKQFVLENRGTLLEHVEKDRNVALNSVVACLMEESHLPLSKLVDDIFERFELGNWGVSVTKASVKNVVLTIGQRLHYGVIDADTDVLEDEDESALWCWEMRDLKWIPKSARNPVKVRRTCRKKVRERINALFATVTALEKLEDHQKWQQGLMKSLEKLAKVLDEADIQLLIQNMLQKDGTEMVEDTKKEEKQLIKQMEKSKREIENERKKMDRELQIEKLHREKELKRLQVESEKEQRRKEKEAAELKRQLAVQKQASIMERFLKQCKTTSTPRSDSASNNTAKVELSTTMAESTSESAILTMNNVLAQTIQADTETIWRLHLKSWRCVRSSMHLNRKKHWGVRQKPKTVLVKELKLTKNKDLNTDEDSSIQKIVDEWVSSDVDKKSSQANMDGHVCSGQRRTWCRQLLQFDKSHRPAFYGVWPRKSQVVGARHPFAKDPDIDYETDSDEEWEEEEPGENLSDCDEEDEEESMEAQLDGDGGSKDGFFVPDGYLSENEGVPGDNDELVDEVRSIPDSEKQVHFEEFSSLLRQQKDLNNLTEHALKKNQPLIISNLMHEKSTSIPVEELTGKEKIEQMFLHTLSARPLPGFFGIGMFTPNNLGDEDPESSLNKPITVPLASATAIPDSALPQIVSIIQSCQQSIGKIVENLHEKFPSISKAQLRNKVREISEFSDNHWQVKKEILSMLGLSTSLAKAKSIAELLRSYLPASGQTMNLSKTPSQSTNNAAPVVPPMQDCSCECSAFRVCSYSSSVQGNHSF